MKIRTTFLGWMHRNLFLMQNKLSDWQFEPDRLTIEVRRLEEKRDYIERRYKNYVDSKESK